MSDFEDYNDAINQLGDGSDSDSNVDLLAGDLPKFPDLIVMPEVVATSAMSLRHVSVQLINHQEDH